LAQTYPKEITHVPGWLLLRIRDLIAYRNHADLRRYFSANQRAFKISDNQRENYFGPNVSPKKSPMFQVGRFFAFAI
jgi:hypothetical protein